MHPPNESCADCRSRTDIEKVPKLTKKTGQELEADLIFRARFTAKPGARFVPRRDAWRRMEETRPENGIDSAPDRGATRPPAPNPA